MSQKENDPNICNVPSGGDTLESGSDSNLSFEQNLDDVFIQEIRDFLNLRLAHFLF